MFKGMFEKKNCDICGEKISVLGNRKLEDGNLCRNCVKKLSPFFRVGKQSGVEDIQRQLLYREENEQALSQFVPTRIFGKRNRVLVDERSGKFIVTYQQDWKKGNPDIIELAQITYVNVDVEEDKDEIMCEGGDGKAESYNSPRYEYEYTFWVEIGIRSPWFESIRFPYNYEKPKFRHDTLYRTLDRELNELRVFLLK